MQTCAAEFVFLDERNAKAQLPGSERGCVASATSAEYNDVKLLVSQVGSPSVSRSYRPGVRALRLQAYYQHDAPVVLSAALLPGCAGGSLLA